MKQISLKDFEVVVDDFTRKTIHVDRDTIIASLTETYYYELDTDKFEENPEIITMNGIDVPRYNCHIQWKRDIVPKKKEYFIVYFRPQNSRETTFSKTLAEFLHFYDNPTGLFRLERLSFQFQ